MKILRALFTYYGSPQKKNFLATPLQKYSKKILGRKSGTAVNFELKIGTVPLKTGEYGVVLVQMELHAGGNQGGGVRNN